MADAPIPIPVPDQELLRAQAFHAGMLYTTPRVFVTFALIAANVLVFIAMTAGGVSLMDPTIEGLLKWGADFGPLTTHGQWWRLVSSMFVHIGVMHILMNMYILFSIGMFVERLYGNLGYFVLYMLAGISGSLLSLAWHPSTVSAGASGAIFGVYGGLLAFVLMQRASIPKGSIAPLLRGAAVFLVFNLVYGGLKSNVDMGAHIGGFIGGVLAGCALAQPLTVSRASRMMRGMLVLVAGLCAAAMAAKSLPQLDDFAGEDVVFEKLEADSIKLFNQSLQDLKADKMPPQAFDDVIEKRLLPPWNAEAERMGKLKLEGKQKDEAAQLAKYMTLRGEGWRLLGEGVRKDDASLVAQANAKQAEAERVAAAIR